VGQIGCAQGVAVTRGSREWREIAVGSEGFGEDSSGGVQEVYGFYFGGRGLSSVVFDNAAGVFEG
jgi:hypothetical protein